MSFICLDWKRYFQVLFCFTTSKQFHIKEVQIASVQFPFGNENWLETDLVYGRMLGDCLEKVLIRGGKNIQLNWVSLSFHRENDRVFER